MSLPIGDSSFYIDFTQTPSGSLYWAFLGIPDGRFLRVRPWHSAAHPANRVGRAGVLGYRSRENDDIQFFPYPLYKPISSEAWSDEDHGPLVMVVKAPILFRAQGMMMPTQEWLVVLKLVPGDVIGVPLEATRDLMTGQLCGIDDGNGLWVPDDRAVAKGMATVLDTLDRMVLLKIRRI